MSRSLTAADELLRREGTEVLEQHPAINSRQARSNFAKIIQAARYKQRRVIITDHGEPAAGLVSIRDIRLLDLLDSFGIPEKLGSEAITELAVDDMRVLILGETDTTEEDHVQRAESHPGSVP